MTRAALPWLLCIGLAAYVAVSLTRRPEPVPDTTGPLVEARDSTEAARARAEALADSLRTAYADSVAAWNAERATLRATAVRARARSDSTASTLRATLDTTQARMLREIEASHRAEVAAIVAEAESYRAQVTALEVRVFSDSLVIDGLHHEIGAWTELDAERQRIESDLRDALRAREQQNRWLKIGGTVVVALSIYERVIG
jgi:hypothetical protein